MPFVLVVIGVVFLVSSVRNTQGQLFTLLKGDFTGTNNFIYWFVSILIIGSIGYIPRLKPISDGFLVLVIVVLFLTKGTGFVSQFNAQIRSTETGSGSNALPSIPALPSLSDLFKFPSILK